MTAIPLAPLSIPLVRFAEPLTKALETEYQAERIIAALRRCPQRRIELDFTGLTDASLAFCDEFFRLAERELPETWLVPRHYVHPYPCLVHELVSRLERLREKTWIKGCESFMTGADPGQRGHRTSAV
ncbi:hypothetical protein [Methylocaldum sp. 14B]|jgi:hypothetical protein|uniref:hypothetical protein n=1 Tax=unclassified Methylocaldum TaxID=2622260 RepID=UPI00098B85F8|nr:hypothetical protein [Methylocaldum sp. 14B]